ncbi:MAG: hypothetical protein EA379_01640 [Phycisphaerales bacterium]|nr:MAG: hypothetical protein EA379_01640 [Phycisphaerales bacterium]
MSDLVLSHPDQTLSPACPAAFEPEATAISLDAAEDRAESRADARARRVALLSVAIVLMAWSDLSQTLSYIRSVGMVELNPLARAVIEQGGVPGLTIFKLLSVTLCVGILLSLRRRVQAELCAWVCVAGMLALTAHWLNYNNNVHLLAPFLQELAASNAAEWVHIPN